MGEDEEDIEEFEMHEDSSDISNRDLTYNINSGEQLKGIELRITNLNEKMKLKTGLITSHSLSQSSSSAVKISQLHAVVEELEILINENFLNRKYDLLTKGNQTEDIIEANEKEDRIEKTEELRKSKIKIQEMENENTKVNFVIKGLCDKLVILETRLNDVLTEKNQLLETMKRNEESKRQKYK